MDFSKRDTPTERSVYPALNFDDWLKDQGVKAEELQYEEDDYLEIKGEFDDSYASNEMLSQAGEQSGIKSEEEEEEDVLTSSTQAQVHFKALEENSNRTENPNLIHAHGLAQLSQGNTIFSTPDYYSTGADTKPLESDSKNVTHPMDHMLLKRGTPLSETSQINHTYPGPVNQAEDTMDLFGLPSMTTFGGTMMSTGGFRHVNQNENWFNTARSNNNMNMGAPSSMSNPLPLSNFAEHSNVHNYVNVSTTSNLQSPLQSAPSPQPFRVGKEQSRPNPISQYGVGGNLTFNSPSLNNTEYQQNWHYGTYSSPQPLPTSAYGQWTRPTAPITALSQGRDINQPSMSETRTPKRQKTEMPSYKAGLTDYSMEIPPSMTNNAFKSLKKMKNSKLVPIQSQHSIMGKPRTIPVGPSKASVLKQGPEQITIGQAARIPQRGGGTDYDGAVNIYIDDTTPSIKLSKRFRRHRKRETEQGKRFDGEEDFTSFSTDSFQYSDENLPPLLGVICCEHQSKSRSSDLLDSRGNPIIGPRGVPLTDVPFLPLRISRKVEKWLIDYWLAKGAQLHDIIVRTLPRNEQFVFYERDHKYEIRKDRNGDNILRTNYTQREWDQAEKVWVKRMFDMDRNALSMRAQRFRNICGRISSSKKGSMTKKAGEELQKALKTGTLHPFQILLGVCWNLLLDENATENNPEKEDKWIIAQIDDAKRTSISYSLDVSLGVDERMYQALLALRRKIPRKSDYDALKKLYFDGINPYKQQHKHLGWLDVDVSLQPQLLEVIRRYENLPKLEFFYRAHTHHTEEQEDGGKRKRTIKDVQDLDNAENQQNNERKNFAEIEDIKEKKRIRAMGAILTKVWRDTSRELSDEEGAAITTNNTALPDGDIPYSSDGDQEDCSVDVTDTLATHNMTMSRRKHLPAVYYSSPPLRSAGGQDVHFLLTSPRETEHSISTHVDELEITAGTVVAAEATYNEWHEFPAMNTIVTYPQSENEYNGEPSSVSMQHEFPQQALDQYGILAKGAIQAPIFTELNPIDDMRADSAMSTPKNPAYTSNDAEKFHWQTLLGYHHPVDLVVSDEQENEIDPDFDFDEWLMSDARNTECEGQGDIILQGIIWAPNPTKTTLRGGQGDEDQVGVEGKLQAEIGLEQQYIPTEQSFSDEQTISDDETILVAQSSSDERNQPEERAETLESIEQPLYQGGDEDLIIIPTQAELDSVTEADIQSYRDTANLYEPGTSYILPSCSGPAVATRRGVGMTIEQFEEFRDIIFYKRIDDSRRQATHPHEEPRNFPPTEDFFPSSDEDSAVRDSYVLQSSVPTSFVQERRVLIGEYGNGVPKMESELPSSPCARRGMGLLSYEEAYTKEQQAEMEDETHTDIEDETYTDVKSKLPSSPPATNWGRKRHPEADRYREGEHHPRKRRRSA
ncbi:hypothetical protein EJ05DRAFT_518544 [Pseudovirgaria hyperparasitica]|uniref:Uncharacterized protein n=1 Tax=Pseudovirgaria hyperparasitica TaxID=470096 RepID=A0A6A6W1J5_9PEZI|nr:uncharacterized protein EJ05DRAFT_518544 [Pseudovirgaria hyperparasitica]KAF2755956.1 hypothetical protein EJ05DRAFT_518544 [Pseudovirgaria hyperparasitica]